MTYFDNLKKKQQDQGGKSWCYTESFMSLTISNLRTTAFYFRNTKLLKQILSNVYFDSKNNMSISFAIYVYVFCDSKKIGH